MPTRLLTLLTSLILMSLFGQISKLWGGSSSDKEEPQNAAQPAATFKSNVSSFWTWYAQNAERLYQNIEDRKSSENTKDVSEAVNKWVGGMAWVFGPGPNKQGHSFTVSPEGDPHRAFLAKYWMEAAPELEGWTFYASRQAGEGDLSGQVITIRDEEFRPEEFWIAPELDIENECIHITAWHPLFKHLSENQQYEILFLWLDEILGERGTADRIGKIELNDSKLKESIAILELGALVKKHENEQEWKSYEPGEVYVGYSMKEPGTGFLRADIFSGTTTHMRLVQDYFSAKGKLEDPLERTGASFIYLAFDNAYLPQGEEVATRAKIEDALIDVLEKDRSGICLGGAIGTENAYIDLLIFDGENSIQLIVDALQQFDLPQGSALYPFVGNADTPIHVFQKPKTKTTKNS